MARHRRCRSRIFGRVCLSRGRKNDILKAHYHKVVGGVLMKEGFVAVTAGVEELRGSSRTDPVLFSEKGRGPEKGSKMVNWEVLPNSRNLYLN